MHPLIAHVFGKQFDANCVKRDCYVRKLCKIFLERIYINLEQVHAGMAWWYRKEQALFDQVEYKLAESRARDQRHGL